MHRGDGLPPSIAQRRARGGPLQLLLRDRKAAAARPCAVLSSI
eukprot:COSAG01_NODE_2294_length_7967_cov_41.570539_11_plen_43_part_00